MDTEDLTRMIVNDFACSQRAESRGKIKRVEGDEQCERENDCDITKWVLMITNSAVWQTRLTAWGDFPRSATKDRRCAIFGC